EQIELISNTKLETGKWTHVAGTLDTSTGEQKLYIDGKLAAKKVHNLKQDVSGGYTLQRFMDGCAGRGAYPIKFNGSIFNTGADGDGADYRTWGSPYWFQNSRLIYWPMLAAGDFEMMQPFFKMFRDAL